jgi:hypothetical protein
LRTRLPATGRAATTLFISHEPQAAADGDFVVATGEADLAAPATSLGRAIINS